MTEIVDLAPESSYRLTLKISVDIQSDSQEDANSLAEKFSENVTYGGFLTNVDPDDYDVDFEALPLVEVNEYDGMVPDNVLATQVATQMWDFWWKVPEGVRYVRKNAQFSKIWVNTGEGRMEVHGISPRLVTASGEYVPPKNQPADQVTLVLSSESLDSYSDGPFVEWARRIEVVG